MKLTPLEAEIFGHRLEVTDCLSDALVCSDENPDNEMSDEEFEEALLGISADELPDNPTPQQIAIIVDCLEGSTFMQAVDEQNAEAPETLNGGKRLAYHRAAVSLERKVSKLVGFDVGLTRH